MNPLLTLAIHAALDAGQKIMEIYEDGFDVQQKQDESPVTQADLQAENIILEHLVKTGIPIISEESTKLPYSERKKWENCWLVDPLDGTKEFIKRNGEFTVNIAYCEQGYPVLGVIYVPASGEMYWGDTEMKEAYKSTLQEAVSSKELTPGPVKTLQRTNESGNVLRVARSRSHLNPRTIEFIHTAGQGYKRIEMVTKGSSLKFGLLAEGLADLYPRFSPTMEWDTAAGHAICKALGFQVINAETLQELKYNKEDLLNPSFIVKRHAIP